MQDVAIIGGGASGLCLAVMLKQRAPTLSVTVFEKNDRVGKKLSITGNGRCNITNTHLESQFYHGDTASLPTILSKFGYQRQKEFFKSLGVLFIVESDGKVYPMSYQAASVTDALRYTASELGVMLLTEHEVTSIIKKENFFEITVLKDLWQFKTVVIACGGQAGGKLGNTSGYRFLKAFNHKVEKTFPSVVQLKTDIELVRQLKGIKVNGIITAVSEYGTRTEQGEILFCDYGLSGPPVLQVSRLSNFPPVYVVLDLMPLMSKDDIREHIKSVCTLYPTRPVSELFTGFMNKRLGQVILKSCGANMKSTIGELGNDTLNKTISSIKSLRLKVVGNTGFEHAQVTAGGAQVSQFFDNLMSKKVKGLFAVGEVMNIDGDCGGFNLSFCWASANSAADGIISYLKECNK
jgi:predicted Rossmann fold flavoprotein